MEQTPSCQREGHWLKEGEGISQRTYVHNSCTESRGVKNSTVIAPGTGPRVGREVGKRRGMGTPVTV